MMCAGGRVLGVWRCSSGAAAIDLQVAVNGQQHGELVKPCFIGCAKLLV